MAKVDANPTVTSKVGSLDLLDVVEIAAGKVMSQEISRRTLIGDANWKSAAVKVIGGFLVNRYVKDNRHIRMLATGVMIDGGEDAIYSLTRGNFAFAIRNPLASNVQEDW